MRLLHAAGQEQSLRHLWVAVRPDNGPAIPLYEKLGFRRETNRPLGQLAAPGELTMVWEPARAAPALPR